MSLARALSGLIFGNEGLSRRLERMAWVHALAQRFRVREWMNSALALRPIRRKLDSGVVYSVENFETLAVERTYFGNLELLTLIAAHSPRTFVDLGCNSGIFPCFLAHATHGKAPRGVCVDANTSQVKIAQKNVALNGWPDIHVLYGLVGSASPDQTESEFHLAPTSLGSSQFAHQETESGYPLDWKRTVVPTLRVETAWTQFFGNELPCDILKVDIEGSEMHFLRQEIGFLKRVNTILLEWHRFGTTREEVVQFLAAHHFFVTATLEDEPRHGLLYFQRL